MMLFISFKILFRLVGDSETKKVKVDSSHFCSFESELYSKKLGNKILAKRHIETGLEFFIFLPMNKNDLFKQTKFIHPTSF